MPLCVMPMDTGNGTRRGQWHTKSVTLQGVDKKLSGQEVHLASAEGAEIFSCSGHSMGQQLYSYAALMFYASRPACSMLHVVCLMLYASCSMLPDLLSPLCQAIHENARESGTRKGNT